MNKISHFPEKDLFEVEAYNIVAAEHEVLKFIEESPEFDDDAERYVLTSEFKNTDGAIDGPHVVIVSYKEL